MIEQPPGGTHFTCGGKRDIAPPPDRYLDLKIIQVIMVVRVFRTRWQQAVTSTHDLHLAALSLHFRQSVPKRATNWISEDMLVKQRKDREERAQPTRIYQNFRERIQALLTGAQREHPKPAEIRLEEAITDLRARVALTDAEAAQKRQELRRQRIRAAEDAKTERLTHAKIEEIEKSAAVEERLLRQAAEQVRLEKVAMTAKVGSPMASCQCSTRYSAQRL